MIRPSVAVALSLALALAACSKDKSSRSDPAPARDPAPIPAPTPAPTPTPTPGASATGDYVELDGKQPIGPAMERHAKAALAAGKKPYAYLHAGWCKPCLALAAARASDPRMQAAFAGTVTIGLDIDAVPAQQLIDQSLPFEVIPVFYRLDASGVPTGDSLDGGAWGEDTADNMAPVLTAFFAH